MNTETFKKQVINLSRTKEIDLPVSFNIDHDCAIGVPFTKCKIINTYVCDRFLLQKGYIFF